VASLLNVLVLNWYTMGSCSSVNVEVCFPHIQPVVMNIVSVAMSLPLYLTLLVLYAKHDINDDRFKSSPEHGPAFFWGLPKRATIEWLVLVFLVVIFSLLTALFVTYLGPCASATVGYVRGGREPVLCHAVFICIFFFFLVVCVRDVVLIDRFDRWPSTS
jgi:hypothetical protein